MASMVYKWPAPLRPASVTVAASGVGVSDRRPVQQTNNNFLRYISIQFHGQKKHQTNRLVELGNSSISPQRRQVPFLGPPQISETVVSRAKSRSRSEIISE